jgi:hypothetical protein
MALAALAAPLIQAMKTDAFRAPYLCTDATGVLVQAPERCQNGHFWVLVAPEKHVLFEFSQEHDSDATAKLLDGYSGYLVADAHVVYDHLYRNGQVVEVGCWAHSRRYFFSPLASDPDRAKVALAYRRCTPRTRSSSGRGCPDGYGLFGACVVGCSGDAEHVGTLDAALYDAATQDARRCSPCERPSMKWSQAGTITSTADS